MREAFDARWAGTMKHLLVASLALVSCTAAQRAPSGSARHGSATSPGSVPAAPRPARAGSASALAPSASSDEPAPDPPTSPELIEPQANGSAPLVAYETPYKWGQRGKLSDPEAAARDQQDIARWNEGGRSGRWHPQPRVTIDNSHVRGQLSESVLLRHLRKHQYWPIRRCYEPALLRDQALHGKLRIQFTVRHTGLTKNPRVLGRPTLSEPAVLECISRSFGGLRVPPTVRGEAVVRVDVALGPGDLPVRPEEDPRADAGQGTLDVHVAQARIATRAGRRIQQCYGDALGRVAELWGRMVLRAEVDGAGALRDVAEVESAFPDADTTQCVVDAVRAVRLPSPEGGPLWLVIPIRFGQPARGASPREGPS